MKQCWRVGKTSLWKKDTFSTSKAFNLVEINSTSTKCTEEGEDSMTKGFNASPSCWNWIFIASDWKPHARSQRQCKRKSCSFEEMICERILSVKKPEREKPFYIFIKKNQADVIVLNYRKMCRKHQKFQFSTLELICQSLLLLAVFLVSENRFYKNASAWFDCNHGDSVSGRYDGVY